MSWNYRVMRHKVVDSAGMPEETLALHEVYYKDDRSADIFTGPGDIGYSANPVAPVAEDLDGLRFVLTEMLKALDKPVLEYQ
jgi:hypothetical protein